MSAVNEQTAISKNDIIAEASRAVHGKLDQYIPVVRKALENDEMFVSHLIAYNRTKSQLRDPKKAFPVLQMSYAHTSCARKDDVEMCVSNAMAHLMLLTPRELNKAWDFRLDLRKQDGFNLRMGRMKTVIKAYLKKVERLPFSRRDQLLLKFRNDFRALYSEVHLNPDPYVNSVIFGDSQKLKKMELPSKSLFRTVRELGKMSPTEAAGHIIINKIPFLVARTACKEHWENETFVMALIGSMTPTEFITNAAPLLKKRGIKASAVLRSSYNDALQKLGASGINALKAQKAVTKLSPGRYRSLMATKAITPAEPEIDTEALYEDAADTIIQIQEKQLDVMKKDIGLDGNWLILGDKSGSQVLSIEFTKQLAAHMARMVKGQVAIAFFATAGDVWYIDVTGKTLDEILRVTGGIRADGGTSIGAGLKSVMYQFPNVVWDGIAIVSDGLENTPPYFPDVYKEYSAKVGKQVPVYFYETHATGRGFSDRPLVEYMKRERLEVHRFDYSNQTVIDYTNLPSIIATMKANPYGLIQEIMDTPLLTFSEALNG